MIGLTSTSISPHPTAYTVTLISIPKNALGRMSGKNARPISPTAEQASDTIIDILYPILSTNLAQNRSTKSCVKKNTVDISAMLPSEIP